MVLLTMTRAMPETSLRVLGNLAALWNLLLFCSVPLVLAWFIYRVYLRRIFRARRIAFIRMQRLMQEAAERDR